eukprot:s4991_g2.t1
MVEATGRKSRPAAKCIRPIGAAPPGHGNWTAKVSLAPSHLQQLSAAHGQGRLYPVGLWRADTGRFPRSGPDSGLNLSEDDLVVNNFGDPRAHEFGFQIGDRIVQVNAIPVFQESDFRFVMKDALRKHETTGEPIIFEVIRAVQKPMAMPPAGYSTMNAVTGMYPATSPVVMKTMLPHEDFEDITGEWCYGKTGDADQFTYLVRKAGNVLSFEQTLPNGQKVTGMLQPEDPQSPWLRSELKCAQGLFGELRIHFDPEEQVLVSQVRPAGRLKWGDERVAKRVES